MTKPVPATLGATPAINHHADALEKLLEISKRLGESSDLNAVLGAIIDALRDLLAAERATVFSYDALTNELIMHSAHGVDASVPKDSIRFSATAGIAGACATTRSIVNIPNAYADHRFNPEVDRHTGYHTTSILAIPLLDHAGALVGVAQVLNASRGSFDRADEQLADGIAVHAGIALRRAQLIHDHFAKLKLEQEMNIAREIQQGAFPQQIPVLAAFDIAAGSSPAEECGGDAYDIFDVAPLTGPIRDGPPERLFFLIADATGHGVGPALSSMQVRGMVRIGVRIGVRTGFRIGFRDGIRLGESLATVASEINSQLMQDLPRGRFVTAWMGALDLATNTIECFSAGQGPVFVYRRRRDLFEEIDTNAPPLGITAEQFDSEGTTTIHLELGDILVLLTDGYFEAVDPDHVEWGREGVFEVVRRMRDEPLEAMRIELDRATLAFAQAQTTHDDRTAILVKRRL
ncbi:MAG: GAF domain-containing protein [Phycisphaerales bacterium]|nr:GAF domain-containing protein [Phycisphaerales bacterium]